MERFLTSHPALPRRAYVAAIAIRGIDGAIETIAGAAVAIAGPKRLDSFVIRITAPSSTMGPRAQPSVSSATARWGLPMRPAASSRSGCSRTAFSNSVLKLALAIELPRGKSWIFPAAAAILAGFIAYMGWRLAGQWSAWLFAFALFDVVTLAFVLNEWLAKTREVRVSPAFSQSG